ncbi:4-hydroxy 2-oxovalerate aldolase [Lachnospiraceae bacterium XBB1006]|nr:4-hydroxy 2-oxovalerate aldolase [Lachnospiraceae bacterium XBB1006]
MSKSIKTLDCTLRDGAYITNSRFGDAAIRGIIKKMQDARVEVIEVGWLKDSPHERGSSYFEKPDDIVPYIIDKNPKTLYTVMIDWDRYDTERLPEYDGKSIDAIRVVFPHGRHKEGIEIGEKIRKKGYKVMFQAANTLAYSEGDLHELAACMNEFKPVSLSIVDTFGAMLFEDLERIASILDRDLDKDIDLGFHAHNNQQLAFALCIHFVKVMDNDERAIMVDSSLNGMGRGAGNATTELVMSYLNRKQYGNYDLNAVMDAIDIYMSGYHEKYTWGYSTPYFIAGLYQCHVNNIAYLQKNHRTSAKDMRTIIESLSLEERRKYDYDLLESKYIENQSRIVDDTEILESLKKEIEGREILLIAPGKSADQEEEKIKAYIMEKNPLVIAVNALNPKYIFDYVIFINRARYEYAKSYRPKQLEETKKILLSNIKTESKEGELIVNYNLVIKRGWVHFDNAVVITLRLLNKIGAQKVSLAGFDGFKTQYNESYADANLPTLNPENRWEELNEEILDIFRDFKKSIKNSMNIRFITESRFDEGE